jgi:hypothetical protein
VLAEAGETVRAAHQLARASEVKTIDELDKANSRMFIDITADLSAPNYGNVGS